jgi:hypothetical protein
MEIHFEALVGKPRRVYLSRGLKENIVYPIAILADKMLMAPKQRIEMLRTTVHQYLQSVVGN